MLHEREREREKERERERERGLMTDFKHFEEKGKEKGKGK